MTTKAYIVANEQQERDVLEKLESQDIIWKYSLSHKTTQFTPSRYHNIVTFPYILKVIGSTIRYGRVGELDENEIVYDGRKEEHMRDKYAVSQEFMNDLARWKIPVVGVFVNEEDIRNLPVINHDWWYCGIPGEEQNNRLIAIIRWMNGEDVFEVEKPKKWVVHDLNTKLYVTTYDGHTGITPNWAYITKFETKEEAESWANSHQEVVEVDE